MLKFRPSPRPVLNVSSMMAVVATAIVLTAAVSRFPGLIELQLGINGGRLTIDGRTTQQVK